MSRAIVFGSGMALDPRWRAATRSAATLYHQAFEFCYIIFRIDAYI
jgi:hypothetical protein